MNKKLELLRAWAYLLFSKLNVFIHKLATYERAFRMNTRGVVTAERVISYGIAFFLIGIVFPIGMDAIMNATTTGWDSAVTTIFQILLPILCVIGIAIDFLPRRGKK